MQRASCLPFPQSLATSSTESVSSHPAVSQDPWVTLKRLLQYQGLQEASKQAARGLGEGKNWKKMPVFFPGFVKDNKKEI